MAAGSIDLRGNPFKTPSGVLAKVPPGLKALKAAAKARKTSLQLA